MLTLNEDLFDDVVEIEIPDVEIQPPLESPDIELAGPDPGQATGEASLILNAISDCAKTIDNYNMMKANLSSSEAGNIIDEIASEETVILGKLQALLKQVSPNAECIPDAIEGAEEVLGESLKEDWRDNEITSKDIEDWSWEMNNKAYQLERSMKTMLRKHPEYQEDIISTAKNCRNIFTNLCSLYNESLRAKRNKKDNSLTESKNDKLEKEIFDFLDDCGGYSDYNQKVEDVMDEWNLDRDTAEGYVWDWSLKGEDDVDESLKEAVGTSVKAKDLLPGHTYGDKDGTFKVVSISNKGLREYPVKVEVIVNGNEDTLYLKPDWKFYEIVESNESLNEENNEVRTIGIYGDEVKGFSSLNSLVNYFKDKGIEVTDVDGDMDYGWEMNLTGNPRKLFFAVVNTIPGYNSDSVQDFIDEYSIDESLKEDTVLYSGSWRDEGGNWQPSTLQYKGFRLKVSKDNLISIYDKHGELVDSGFKTKKSAVDAIDSGEYDGLNESKLNEGDWEDPEWRKYYGVDDDSFYDDLPVELEPEETFDDIDDTFEESFKETSKFLDPITHKLKVEAWEPVEQSQEEPNKIDDQIPDDMEVDDEF